MTNQGKLSPNSLLLSNEEMEAHRRRSEDFFRTGRVAEGQLLYLKHFQDALSTIENMMVRLNNLQRFGEETTGALIDPQLIEGLRFVTGPPVSIDDLKVIVGSSSLSPRALQTDKALSARIVEILRSGLDSRRFPWVMEHRAPSYEERYAAVLATVSLMATRRTETNRRSASQQLQELRVLSLFNQLQLEPVQIPGNVIGTLSDGPKHRQFCREVILGGAKADFVVGLVDGRTMAIECKVSNSSVNSVKRLNREAAGKAAAWLDEYGTRQIVPVAVISGVYKLHNLLDAQHRGLFIVWDHDLIALESWLLHSGK